MSASVPALLGPSLDDMSTRALLARLVHLLLVPAGGLLLLAAALVVAETVDPSEDMLGFGYALGALAALVGLGFLAVWLPSWLYLRAPAGQTPDARPLWPLLVAWAAVGVVLLVALWT